MLSDFLDFCAGRENRTPVSSLARTYSTTKPYPQSSMGLKYLIRCTMIYQIVDSQIASGHLCYVGIKL